MGTPTITLASTQTELAAWVAARAALVAGASYSMNGRTLTSHDLAEVKRTISELSSLEARFLEAQRTGNGIRRFNRSVGRLV